MVQPFDTSRHRESQEYRRYSWDLLSLSVGEDQGQWRGWLDKV